MNTKNIVLGVLVAILLVGATLYFSKSSPPPVGSPNPTGQVHYSLESFLQGLLVGPRSQFYLSNTGALTTSATVTVGSSGTALNRLNTGTCYLAPYATTITASTSASVDCQATAGWSASGTSALTGVTSGDFVQVRLSTTTAKATVNGLYVIGASASTTAGHIELLVSNLTGTTFTWPLVGSATGTASYLVTN